MSTPQTARILIVDDEPALMKALCDALRDHSYETVGFVSAHVALRALRETKFELLLCDLKMPEMSGIDLLREAMRADRDIVGIIMTGQGAIDTAVEAMKTGAFDYILKPFKLSVILPVLARALALRRLRLENAKLERHLRRRTAELEATTRELEAFSYSVSHDLRAPLRAIAGFSDALQEDFGDTLHPQAKEHLDRVRNAAARMGQLIDDLLRLAKVSRGEIQQSVVDLSVIAKTIATDLRRTSPDRAAGFVISPGVTATGDPRLLEVALANLLGNAWKYTSKQAEAHIEFGVRRDAEPVYFVADNGVGFDMRNVAKLFSPFQRLHSPDEFEGNGIGLATVDRIIRRHGGRIWAESTQGKGAVFQFTLGLGAGDGQQRCDGAAPLPATQAPSSGDRDSEYAQGPVTGRSMTR